MRMRDAAMFAGFVWLVGPAPAPAQEPPPAPAEPTPRVIITTPDDGVRVRLRGPEEAPASGPTAEPEAVEVDEGPLWRLYETGDYARVRAEIERMRQRFPGWSPPRDLLSLMSANEVQSAFRNALANRQWGRISELAARHPGQLACARIDNMWAVAEAEAAQERPDAALNMYRRILVECSRPADRAATLEKAAAVLPADAVAPLIEQERRRAVSGADRARLERLERDLARRALVGALREPDASAAPAPSPALLEAALRERDAGTAMLVGWWHHRRGEWPQAIAWFEQAMNWQPGAEAAEGLALSYLETGREEDAERVVAIWSSVSPALDRIGVQVRVTGAGRALDRGDYARCLSLSDTDGAADADAAATLAAIRGWCLYQLERPHEAIRAFEAALRNSGGALPASDGAAPADAAQGLVLAKARTGALSEAVALADRYGLSRDQRRALEAERLGRQAIHAYERGLYRDALAYLQERQTLVPQDRNLAVIEAWSLYQLGRYDAALALFESLDRAMPTADIRDAIRITKQRINPLFYAD